jgi:hypothetical protein
MQQKEQQTDRQKEAPRPEEVIAFVHKNKKKVEPVSAADELICVDGRYSADGHAENKIAVPGADLGLCMALLDPQFNLSPQDAFNYVNDFLIANGGTFTWHTDTHEGHGCVVGCGHCNAAIEKSEKYGLQRERVEELLKIVRHHQQTSDDGQLPSMHCEVLQNDHLERAILVIKSLFYTVEHSDEEDQYFGYDEDRYHAFVSLFIRYMAAEEPEVELDYNALIDVIDKQKGVTLGLLGSSKGKEVFIVTIDEERNVDAQSAGHVEPLD